MIDNTEDAYREGGSGAAWGEFISLVMHSGPVPADGVPPATWPPPGAEEAGGPPEPPSEKQQADDELFFLRMLKPFTRYEPKVDQLRSGAPRVVIAMGESSREELAKCSAVALAERLGQPAVVFPGDHGGFMADPAAFAAKIREVLAESG